MTTNPIFPSGKALNGIVKARSVAPEGAIILYDYEGTTYTFGPDAVKVSKLLSLPLEKRRLIPTAGQLLTEVCTIPSKGSAVASLQLKGQSVTVCETDPDTGKRHIWSVDPLA